QFLDQGRTAFPDACLAYGRSRAATSTSSSYQPIRRAIDGIAKDARGHGRERVFAALRTLVASAPELMQDLPYVKVVLKAGQAVAKHVVTRGESIGAGPDRNL